MPLSLEQRQQKIHDRAIRLVADGYRFGKGPRLGRYSVTSPSGGSYTITLARSGDHRCSCPYRGPSHCKHIDGLRMVLRSVPALDNGEEDDLPGEIDLYDYIDDCYEAMVPMIGPPPSRTEKD